jgi:hypothetical protein
MVSHWDGTRWRRGAPNIIDQYLSFAYDAELTSTAQISRRQQKQYGGGLDRSRDGRASSLASHFPFTSLLARVPETYRVVMALLPHPSPARPSPSLLFFFPPPSPPRPFILPLKYKTPNTINCLSDISSLSGNTNIITYHGDGNP